MNNTYNFTMQPKAQILLATYNGEKFLQEQLDSILDQTYTDWEILARDDGSNDSTLNILDNFRLKYPDKITFIEDDDKNLGPCFNFARLMEYSTADIICFADQDDVWHPDKVERSIACLEKIQNEYGAESPVLVHHDYSTMNEQGKIKTESFEQENKTGKDNSSLEHILVQNIVYGFSATTNRALVDKALPLPKSLDMHDTHLGLVASTFGHMHYIPEQLANYRIHNNNVSGGHNPFYNISTKDFSLRNLFNGHGAQCIRSLFNEAHERLKRKCDYADSFLERYGDEMSPEKRRLFEDFVKLSETGPLERKKLIVQHHFYPSSPKMAAAFLAFG